MKLQKMRIRVWQVIVFDSLNLKSILLLELAIEILNIILAYQVSHEIFKVCTPVMNEIT